MANYYLIGIKGAGMSSLACMLYDFGHNVRGSDVAEYYFTEDKLKEKKIEILPFSENNIKPDDIVIVGNAFLNHKEQKIAEELNCEVQTYYDYLGKLSMEFNSIAITGSHGKTTTTNLIRQILEYDDKINYLIGDGQGSGNNQSDLFVFEACEYKRHFLHYYPKIAVLTNIDYDHPDYYKDIYDVQKAFKQFVSQSDLIVYNGDDSLLKDIIGEKECISYGLDQNNDYYAENIYSDQEHTHFDLYFKGKYLTNISIPLFGMHSVHNTLAAIATALVIIKKENVLDIIKSELISYNRGKRRFEECIVDGQVVISDYAHHPKEIKATLEAVGSKYPFKKIIVYFEPHTYSRTITFLNEFSESLSVANFVYLRKIFSSARENVETIDIYDLAKCIEGSIVIDDNRFIEEFKKYRNSVIIFMGAGDIDKYCNLYIDSFK